MNKASISPRILAILSSMKSGNEEYIVFISNFLLPYIQEKGSYYRAKDEIYQKMKELLGEEMVNEN